MKMVFTRLSVALGFFLAISQPGAAFAGQSKNGAPEYPANYEGGSLPLRHSKVTATLGADEVVLEQRGQRIAVPANDITEIACATGVHRRLGASVLDVVPYMHLGETQSHYIGVTWMKSGAADGKTPTAEVLFKLSKSEYASFLAGLERLTGKKAVDTNQTLTTVHYD
jgi:hypothetical protein